ncbi:amidohydrolase family protein [Propionibacteriaceae bacterium Y2011]|uniref:amidohydrolase family protein n=1 Tax=Microlunatus sp. Y2014 TaxID=3418488 RepID=UPI003B4BD6DD
MAADPAQAPDIVDVHVHHGPHLKPWLTDDPLADLATTARRAGVSAMMTSVLGQQGYTAQPTVEDLQVANDFCLRAVESDPIYAGLVYTSPDHVEESLGHMRRLIAEGPFVGIKLWVARRASDPALDPIVGYAAELGVPVLQHAWYKTVGQLPGESTPADVADLARRHPDATIQMAHLSGCGERGVLDVAPYPNVVVDTCGGDPEDGIMQFAVDVLGPERVLYGSDAPGRDFGVQLARVYGAGLAPDVLAAVLGGNARRIYSRLAPAVAA